MKYLGNLIFLCVVFVAVGLMFYYAYEYSVDLYTYIHKMQPQEQNVVMVVLVVAVVLLFFLLRRKSSITSFNISAEASRLKIDLYGQVLNALLQNDQELLIKVSKEQAKHLVLLADDSVLDGLNKLVRFYENRIEDEARCEQLQFGVLKSMRRDLGARTGIRIQALEDFFKSRKLDAGGLPITNQN